MGLCVVQSLSSVVGLMMSCELFHCIEWYIVLLYIPSLRKIAIQRRYLSSKKLLRTCLRNFNAAYIYYVCIYNFDPLDCSSSLTFCRKFFTSSLIARSINTSSLPPGTLTQGTSLYISSHNVSIPPKVFTWNQSVLSTSSPWPDRVSPFPPKSNTKTVKTPLRG